MTDEHVTHGNGAPHRGTPELPDAAELKKLAASRPERLYQMAEQACRHGHGQGPDATVTTRTVARIAEALAVTRSPDCARLATDLVGELLPPGPAFREQGDGVRRSVAAMLVTWQQLRDLEPLFRELPAEVSDPAVEVRACILGELALIGAGCGRPVLDTYAERLRELEHPLAWLPRVRLDLEHRFAMKVRGVGSIKSPDQLRSRFPEIPPTDSGSAAGRTVGEILDVARTQSAAAPFTVAGWACPPEARFFTLPNPLDPDDFGISFIKALPLACLAGEGSRRGAALACQTTADDVANELFSATFYGGVNNNGPPQEGAYARLHTWRSLYALMGLPTDTPFLDAVRYANDHRWLRFMAFTDWFHHDTSDAAFAALDSSRSRVSVLAATDTDLDYKRGP